MKRALATLAALLVIAAAPAAALESGELRFEHAPLNRLDVESLQRGARTFVNYCLNCHSAKYMRYNRLTDIGLTEDQIRKGLNKALPFSFFGPPAREGAKPAPADRGAAKP